VAGRVLGAPIPAKVGEDAPAPEDAQQSAETEHLAGESPPERLPFDHVRELGSHAEGRRQQEEIPSDGDEHTDNAESDQGVTAPPFNELIKHHPLRERWSPPNANAHLQGIPTGVRPPGRTFNTDPLAAAAPGRPRPSRTAKPSAAGLERLRQHAECLRAHAVERGEVRFAPLR